jgi:hypothetical protein
MTSTGTCGGMVLGRRKAFGRATLRATDRETRRGTLVTYVLWMCFVPIVLALGVRDQVAAAITGGSVVLSTILSWVASRRRSGGSIRFVVYCLDTLAITSTCTLLGWAVVVPGLAAVHTVGPPRGGAGPVGRRV